MSTRGSEVSFETHLVFVSAWREIEDNLYDPGTESGVAQMPSEVMEYDDQQLGDIMTQSVRL